MLQRFVVVNFYATQPNALIKGLIFGLVLDGGVLTPVLLPWTFATPAGASCRRTCSWSPPALPPHETWQAPAVVATLPRRQSVAWLLRSQKQAPRSWRANRHRLRLHLQSLVSRHRRRLERTVDRRSDRCHLRCHERPRCTVKEKENILSCHSFHLHGIVNLGRETFETLNYITSCYKR